MHYYTFYLYGFNFSAFSTSNFLANNGISDVDITSDLWEEVINFVADVVGLDKYYFDKPCTFTDTQYTDAVDRLNDGNVSLDIALIMITMNTVVMIDV